MGRSTEKTNIIRMTEEEMNADALNAAEKCSLPELVEMESFLKRISEIFKSFQ